MATQSQLNSEGAKSCLRMKGLQKLEAEERGAKGSLGEVGEPKEPERR